MQKQIVLAVSLLIAATTIQAGDPVLESAAKQLATDAATAVAPQAVGNVQQVQQAVEQVKALNNALGNAPQTAAEQAQTAVAQPGAKPQQAAAPEAAKQDGGKALQKGAEQGKKTRKHGAEHGSDTGKSHKGPKH